MQRSRLDFKTDMQRHGSLYLLVLPAVLLVLVFSYLPFFGIIIAFKDYNIFAGDSALSSMFQSPTVGLANFERLFSSPDFWQIFRNTIAISSLKLLFGFPAPIILAILLNEVRHRFFKRGVQTVLYLPHFLSWVVVSGLFFQLLGVYGPINGFLQAIHVIKEPISFWQDERLYWPLLVLTDIWKNIGWSSIIYLAAIAGLDQPMFEAAEIDGATRPQQILYLLLPGISSTIMLLLILALGGILNAGFDQILNTYSVQVYSVGDVIETYVFRQGLGQQDYSYATAVGLLNSLVAFILIMGGNSLARKFFHKGMW